MKRLRIIILATIFILLPAMCFAAGASVTMTRTKADVPYSTGFQKVVIVWVADDTSHLTPNTSFDVALVGGSSPLKGWSCCLAVTDPGTTAPTADYDISIEDDYGADIFGGELVDRHTSSTEQAVPLMATGTYIPRLVTGNLTFKVTGQLVNSATGTCVLYFILEN